MQIQSALTPSARNDQRLDKVALHAVEIGRLVVLVQEAERHQEKARAQPHILIELAIDVELLDLELARIRRGRDRVLDFELGVQFRATVEDIADAEHRAGEIGLRFLLVVRGARVVSLTVTP